MKTIKTLFVFASILFASTVYAHEKTDSVKVYGNCEMCKNRIEKAAKIEGISKAEWNVETKFLTLVYDTHKVKLDDVQRKIADAGHDTEKFSADSSVYNDLPECCKYERKEKEGKQSGLQ